MKEKTNPAKEASWFVQRRISWLCARANYSSGKADLARLRRGIGKAPGSQPELWQVILEDLPESLLSSSGEPSCGEWAVHTALTLYALHQQGEDAEKHCVSKEGISLGSALRKLAPDRDNDEAIKRRFDAAATAGDFVELAHHLRGLIQLMKAKNIDLDYPALTRDLYWFQIMDKKDSVRLKWGQDFYRVEKEEKSDNNVQQDAQA
ncbi:MAG: type I-E CRISPR-associated protein Cse2/CasB [Desulfarculales bacterium]|jgi:CRISPR system Cascade subunit CasB|nr:type I-E CRISPR-associated protein Cse2/CasB [Desulfarculales bacterium]